MSAILDSQRGPTPQGVAEKTVADEDRSLLERSLLYRVLLAEQKEIFKHKWLESEKAGHDIGLECALTDWVIHHRRAWRKACKECRPVLSQTKFNG